MTGLDWAWSWIDYLGLGARQSALSSLISHPDRIIGGVESGYTALVYMLYQYNLISWLVRDEKMLESKHGKEEK